MPAASRLVLVLLVLLVRCPTAWSAGPPFVASAEGTPDELFGLTRVWSLHLTIQARDWDRMQPARGGFSGRPTGKEPPLTEDRKRRGGFGFDFEYVRAGLTIDGLRLADVGVRFKGNSTYLVTSKHLKRPFKIDLDRHDEEQTFKGVRKLTLNNNVMDPTTAREVLSYGIYRAMGVPTPRTAYAQVSLSVPGKYDRVFVGLYTLIETVDRTFLEDRFGNGKGLLLKPEGVGPLDYLGEKWPAYEARYRPKTKANKAAQQRFVDLVKLVQQADDARFHAEIASFVDLDRFLRYVAATVALSSLDSFVGFGHNYYLYLDQKTNKFVFIPWDLDHSFGGLTLLGSADELINLSIRQPYAGRNRLIERLLANKTIHATYTRYLRGLLEKTFTSEAIQKDLVTLEQLLRPIRDRERKAVADRREGWNTWTMFGMFNRPADVRTFVKKRTLSLEAQLAGKSDGVVLRSRFGQPAGADRLARPIVQAADTNKDGKLSREEAVAGAKALYQACNRDRTKQLDEKTLAVALGRILPRPGFGQPPLAQPLAKALLARAGKEGRLTEEGLVSATEKMFAKTDRNRNGTLEHTEVESALRELLPPGPPNARAAADSDKKVKGER